MKCYRFISSNFYGSRFPAPSTNESRVEGTESMMPSWMKTGLCADIVNRAYPTNLGVENPVYSWQGTLPTIDAMGKPVCSTVKSPSHVTIPYQATLTP